MKPKTTGITIENGVRDETWIAQSHALQQSRKTDTEDLSIAIKIFEANLPGWWWSIGPCSISRDASCGPDLNGPDANLLKLSETKIFDEGFHCDLKDGCLAEALGNVMEQALEAKAKWKKQ